MNGKHINEHLILVESEQHPMKTSAIKKDISEFHGAMLEAQRDLDAFSHSIKSSLSGVVKEIDMQVTLDLMDLLRGLLCITGTRIPFFCSDSSAKIIGFSF